MVDSLPMFEDSDMMDAMLRIVQKHAAETYGDGHIDRDDRYCEEAIAYLFMHMVLTIDEAAELHHKIYVKESSRTAR